VTVTSPDRPLTSGVLRISRPEAFVSTASRSNPTTLAFHASRIVVDVGVLVVMGNRSSVALDALPTVLLLVPIFVVTLIPDHTRPLPRVLGWISLVLGLAAFPFAIVKYLDSSVLAGTLGGSIGMGPRLLILGTFVTLVGIVIGLARSAMGLATGGTPARRTAVRTRGTQPAVSSAAEESTKVPDAVATAGSPTKPVEAPASTPAPGSHPQPKPRPLRPMPDENTFIYPLFDSLEIPSIVDADKQGSLTFEGESASDRVADDEA
jgi:hypothetical protein